jgi:hypothetical protein
MARSTEASQIGLAAAEDLTCRYDALCAHYGMQPILDDIAYVTKDQAETSVIFELIAARYERRSMLITANQPFGEWGRIFPDQVMTLAAVDRLVHHTTIFEMNVESYRRRAAVERKRGPGRPPRPAAAQHGERLFPSLGLGRHARPYPSRALREVSGVGRAGGQPDGGDHRQPERQERGKRGRLVDPNGFDAGKKIKGKKRHVGKRCSTALLAAAR